MEIDISENMIFQLGNISKEDIQQINEMVNEVYNQENILFNEQEIKDYVYLNIIL